MASIELRQLCKDFGTTRVLHDVDLQVRDGEFVVLVGPSGCGKSTLLRCIAGLEDITSGELLIDGRRMNDVASSQRGLSMVFQNYALYPHMTVAENMSFGLRMADTPPAEIERAVRAAAEVLQIVPLLARKPGQLSGGQRQRVAIGRAIVRRPGVFLFDEPLSNLDAALRSQMRIEIARLHETLRTTIVYVTHDQAEAMTLADRIVVFNAGRIEQVGPPLALYRQPCNTFVAGFLGSPRINLLEARVLPAAGGALRAQPAAASGALELPWTAAPLPEGAPLTLGVRPEQLAALAAGAAPPAGGIALAATVQLIEHLGDVAYVHARSATGTALTARCTPDIPLRAGDAVQLCFRAEDTLAFDDTGRALPRRDAIPPVR